MTNAEEKYKDIINLPHPVSKNHPQMPLLARAAQFAPFAALNGFEEAISYKQRSCTIQNARNKFEISDETCATGDDVPY